MKSLLLIVLSLISSISSALYCGFVTMKLWDWFIPSITHLNPISYTNACGFGIFVSYLTTRYAKEFDDSDSEYVIKSWLFIMIYSTLTLGFGYLFA